MSTVKVTNLQNASSASPNIVLDSSGNATMAGSMAMATPFAMKNKIINGAMEIDQRNAGASVTIPGTPAYTYPVDRMFFYNNSGTTFTAQRSTTAPTGFINSVLTSFSSTITPSAGQEVDFTQFIEGYNIADLGWGTAGAKSVTVSFWVRSSLTGTFGFGIGNGGGTRAYGTTYAINAANTWEYKSVTIPGDTTGTWATDNTGGLFLRFYLSAGSNFVVSSNNTWTTRAGSYGNADSIYGVCPTGVSNLSQSGATWYITGVQLEVGTVATPFERRLYPQELAMCQRYFFSVTNPVLRGVFNTTSLANRCGMTLPVTMRTQPTVATSGTGNLYDGNNISSFTTVNAAYTSVDAVELDITAAGAAFAQYRVAITYLAGGTTFKINISAEL